MKEAPTEDTEASTRSNGGSAGPSTEKPRPDPRRRRALVVGGIALGIVAAVGGVAYYLHSRHYESTDDAFIEGRVTSVSARVAAHVLRLLVDDNQDVVEGQLLLELDAADLDARLAAARARLTAAESRLASAEAGVERAAADVKSAEAEASSDEVEAARAENDLKRYEAAGDAVTRQSLDNARALHAATGARLSAAREKTASARSQVPFARSQVAVARADIEEAKAQVREAELQVSYTKVHAPVAGRVTRRAVEVGDYLQPGQSVLALVERRVWVIANFRESQLEHMRPGQPVAIKIDPYPGRTFQGEVESIMRGTGARFSLLPPENATGNYVKVVQRVPVKIVFKEALPEEREIGVGMSVVPRVTVR